MYRFETYEGRDELWYWRLRAPNGNVIADGSEGYANRSNARRAARRMKVAVYRAEIA